MKSHKVPLMDEAVVSQNGTHLTMRVQLPSSKKIVHVPIEDFYLTSFRDRYLPVRASSNYRQRKNRIGFLWLATTGRLVPFESTLERAILLDLDYDPTVVGVWTQPFRVDGLDGERDHKYVRPYPDVLVEYDDGRLEVVDVKPERAFRVPTLDQFDDKNLFVKAKRRWQAMNANFAYLATEFDAVGWDYSIRCELSQERRSNLEYVSHYRRSLPASDGLAEQVLDAVDGPIRLDDLANRIDGGFVSAMPVILHLIWHHRLHADLDEPLNAATFASPVTQDEPALGVAP